MLSKSQRPKVICGVDEAGRGAWAGPLVASAVIWPEDNLNLEINDSKQLTPIVRERLFLYISKTAIAVGIGIVSVEEIDALGLGEANRLAMRRAVGALTPVPDFALVDGYNVEFENIDSVGVVGGDGMYLPIAAASIMAKVTRDRMMVQLDSKYPEYGFAMHKGYGTALHQRRLAEGGVLAVHRKSFAPIARLLEFNNTDLILTR